jgi:glycosyltransferase involved in cell wall biosynthesis
MKLDNLIIYVSSRNNYDMLKGEVLKINFEGFEFINVDDCSTDEEIEKGRLLCRENNIVYLQNKGRGVQMATQTLIDFINENRPNCKFIICFQHDSAPISENFFKTLSEYIATGNLDDIGGLGFNVLDNGKYTFNMYHEFLNGGTPLGILGFSHLGISSTKKRWISPWHNPEVLGKNTDKWNKPFILETKST